MKSVIRDRHLTSDEAEWYTRLRGLIEKEFPPLEETMGYIYTAPPPLFEMEMEQEELGVTPSRRIWIILPSERPRKRWIARHDDWYLYVFRREQDLMHRDTTYGINAQMVERFKNLNGAVIEDWRGKWYMPMEDILRCLYDRHPYARDGNCYEFQFFMPLDKLKQIG